MLSALLLCWEAEDFLDACIADAVGNVDELVIIEGRYQPGPERRSTDRTLDILRNWKDCPKIKMVINDDDSVVGQDGHRNLFFDISDAKQGDYMLVLDFDEFYSADDWKEIRRIEQEKDGVAWQFDHRVFLNNFDHYVEMTMPRLVQIQDGCKFLPNGNFVVNEYGDTFPYVEHPSVKIFHYSYVTSHRYFNMKVDQRHRLEGRTFAWELEDNIIKRKVNEEFGHKEVFRFDGDHPKIIRDRYL